MDTFEALLKDLEDDERIEQSRRKLQAQGLLSPGFPQLGLFLWRSVGDRGQGRVGRGERAGLSCGAYAYIGSWASDQGRRE